jgi:ribosome-associated translation inhibitor RaiA
MDASIQIPVQVTFRNLGHSEAIEAKIQERARKLGSFYPHIMSCRVAVEALHRHHVQGNHFHIRIDVKVPGGELVAGREPDEHHSYTDVYVAIRDAFDAIRRQLEDHARLQQGKVKAHETPQHGQVVELNPDKDHGRIETSDGRLIYFHRNSLVEGDFDQLAVEDEVRLIEEMGEEGPQASTVHLVGKHRLGS